MSLDGFDRLLAEADARREPAPAVAAGGDDPSVLLALGEAARRGWVAPLVVGAGGAIREAAESAGVALDGFEIVEADDVASAAVGLLATGRARIAMKGRVATPELVRALLQPSAGLRTGRLVGQVVLMELPRDDRRFLMVDTGITIRPTLEQKADLLKSAVAVAHDLGCARPRVAAMAATESINPAMPETLDAAELQALNARGELADCVVQGPLSFDLAYAPGAAGAKRVGGDVAGAADVMIFPDLLSANLTVKAMMYTADCRFGGVLVGLKAPVAFMSRADEPSTRLRSLALALRRLDRAIGR